MKLNKLSIIFAAMFSLAPHLVYPVMPFVNAILRITEWKKPGCPDVTLCGDRHDIEYSRQELEMLKGLFQKKYSHVYVEDWLEHVGDNPHKDKIVSSIQTGAIKMSYQTLSGLVNKIKKAGGAASNVECRMRMRTSIALDIPHQESVQDYKNIMRGLKELSPKDPTDILSNTVIEKIEELEKSSLKKLKTGDAPALTDLLTMCGEQVGDSLSLKQLRKKPMFARRLSSQEKSNLLNGLGNATVDVIAFKQLCKNNDGLKQKFLVAGAAHCDNVEMLLKEVGYKNTRRLEEDSAFLGFNEYKQFFPQHCNVSTTKLSNKDFMPPVSPEQIKEYFQNPKSYTVPKQNSHSSFDWLKNKVSAIMGRA